MGKNIDKNVKGQILHTPTIHTWKTVSLVNFYIHISYLYLWLWHMVNFYIKYKFRIFKISTLACYDLIDQKRLPKANSLSIIDKWLNIFFCPKLWRNLPMKWLLWNTLLRLKSVSFQKLLFGLKARWGLARKPAVHWVVVGQSWGSAGLTSPVLRHWVNGRDNWQYNTLHQCDSFLRNLSLPIGALTEGTTVLLHGVTYSSTLES